jgi:UDP-N-acetylmuramate--alanine ligase
MRHKVKHVHFIGIGGSGMSGIAEVLHSLGYTVTGSDLSESATVTQLRGQGIRVQIGHAARNVAGADAVVVSSAVKADNPEVIAARAAKMPVVPRAMMLAELMRFKRGIAIAGTHGKTTTTSLVASILAEGGLDPTYVIGGRLNAVDLTQSVPSTNSARHGSGEYLVAEADESDASFLYLQPSISVVTNIDADHMETYGQSLTKLESTFVEFLEHLPFYGLAVLCNDDARVRSVAGRISKPIATYGVTTNADLIAKDIQASGITMRFSAVSSKAPTLAITLNLAGQHNVLNALAAITVAREVGVTDSAIAKALAQFRGVGRRFQQYGDVTVKPGCNVTLIDDYGHHPAEVAATVAAARGAFPGRRVLLAFQPHRYSRTRDLFEDFANMLSSVDSLVLADVYPAGEEPIALADGKALARAVRLHGKVEPRFVPEFAQMPAAIIEHARDGDIVMTMGAGSVGTLPNKIISLAQTGMLAGKQS